MKKLLIGKTKNIKVDDCQPYENNIPIHTQEDIESLKDWLESVGYRSRIGLDKNNVIVYGHKRHAALMLDYKFTTIPVDDLSDLSPQKIKKLRIADNSKRTTNYDEKKLEKELKSIYDNFEDSAGLIEAELNIDIDEMVRNINKTFEGEGKKIRMSSDKLVKVILEYTTKDKTKFDIFSRDIMDKAFINSVSDLFLFLLKEYSLKGGKSE